MTWALTIVFFSFGRPVSLEVGVMLSEPICDAAGRLLATEMAQKTGAPAGWKCEELT